MTTRGYVAVNISPAARDQLRQLAYQLTGKTGRRVTLDAAMVAAVRLASQEPDKAIAELPE